MQGQLSVVVYREDYHGHLEPILSGLVTEMTADSVRGSDGRMGQTSFTVTSGPEPGSAPFAEIEKRLNVSLPARSMNMRHAEE